RPQLLDKGRMRGTLYRQLEALFNLPAILEADTTVNYVQQFTLPDLQLAGARRGNFYYAAKGGHNDESHNHNDVGNFILYYKNKPLLIDVGVEYYTAKTFSPQRYEIWTMQSQYHNVPYINGVAQKEGRSFKAENFKVSHTSSQGSRVSVDISKAYPAAAGVDTWTRNYHLPGTGKKFIIKDRFRLNARKDSTWSTILVAIKPRIERDCMVLETEKGVVKMKYNLSVVKPLIEELAVTDAKLIPVWGDKIYRIKVLLTSAGNTGEIVLTVEE
ncbi:MAG TPA: heparinase II/III family protein, partial [Niabella sp.]|nr:heparinase II/III family protein [Niabella sp.]